MNTPCYKEGHIIREIHRATNQRNARLGKMEIKIREFASMIQCKKISAKATFQDFINLLICIDRCRQNNGSAKT